VTVVAAGGTGGTSGSQAGGPTAAGGKGGTVSATYALAPGTTVSAIVGCNGANGGGFSNTATPQGYAPGGGTGRGSIIAGQAGASGGSGGGASAACLGSGCTATSPGVAPLVVAGGGGGGGVSNCAGTSSGAGGAGGAASATAAGGGSGPSGSNGASASSGGGAGGVNSSGGAASGGANGDGSGGAGVNVVGGGGGGGYVGGAAGANTSTGCKGAGGGGGGSSWAKATGTGVSTGTASAGPSVTLTFKLVIPWTPCPSDKVPFVSAEALVRQQFADLAGRQPTNAELDTWVGGINRCEKTADELITSLLSGDQTSDDARLVRLYLAYFKRPPDPDGFAYWQRQLDAGRGLVNAALKFAQSSEFTRTYGSLSNGDFIDLVYLNVLGREPDPTGRAFWLTRLDNKTKNRGEVMINFSESSENVRTKANHVQVFRLFRAMRGRFPSKTEYFALLDPITNSGKTLADAAKSIRYSPEYDARV
jgi:hypothetical protein